MPNHSTAKSWARPSGSYTVTRAPPPPQVEDEADEVDDEPYDDEPRPRPGDKLRRIAQYSRAVSGAGRSAPPRPLVVRTQKARPAAPSRALASPGREVAAPPRWSLAEILAELELES
jgi:hypothetical protein